MNRRYSQDYHRRQLEDEQDRTETKKFRREIRPILPAPSGATVVSACPQ